MNYQAIAIILFVFAAGFGWGKFFGEKSVRKEIAQQQEGRLLVSMPLDPDVAADTMDMLKHLLEKVRQERAEEDGRPVSLQASKFKDGGGYGY